MYRVKKEQGARLRVIVYSNLIFFVSLLLSKVQHLNVMVIGLDGAPGVAVSGAEPFSGQSCTSGSRTALTRGAALQMTIRKCSYLRGGMADSSRAVLCGEHGLSTVGGRFRGRMVRLTSSLSFVERSTSRRLRCASAWRVGGNDG